MGAPRPRRGVGDFAYEAKYLTLLGVRDDLRQGALRFRDPADGTALAPPPGGVPPLVELPRLLAASERLDRDEPDAEDLRLLLQGGSSLGGARPKAHVRAADGRLAIAKFPRPSQDAWDVIRWEAVALELWRRVAFSVAISNTDDHLRNHGFLRTSTAGWSLAPAFDLLTAGAFGLNPSEMEAMASAFGAV